MRRVRRRVPRALPALVVAAAAAGVIYANIGLLSFAATGNEPVGKLRASVESNEPDAAVRPAAGTLEPARPLRRTPKSPVQQRTSVSSKPRAQVASGKPTAAGSSGRVERSSSAPAARAKSAKPKPGSWGVASKRGATSPKPFREESPATVREAEESEVPTTEPAEQDVDDGPQSGEEEDD